MPASVVEFSTRGPRAELDFYWYIDECHKEVLRDIEYNWQKGWFQNNTKHPQQKTRKFLSWQADPGEIDVGRCSSNLSAVIPAILRNTCWVCFHSQWLSAGTFICDRNVCNNKENVMCSLQIRMISSIQNVVFRLQICRLPVQDFAFIRSSSLNRSVGLQRQLLRDQIKFIKLIRAEDKMFQRKNVFFHGKSQAPHMQMSAITIHKNKPPEIQACAGNFSLQGWECRVLTDVEIPDSQKENLQLRAWQF